MHPGEPPGCTDQQLKGFKNLEPPAFLSQNAVSLVEKYPLLHDYVDLLAAEGKSWGLIGANEDLQRLWERHVLNSLALEPLLPQLGPAEPHDALPGGAILDVGSGAGLPGIPLAILRGDLHFTLLDSKQRRVEFLKLVVTRLGLAERVSVQRGRAEELDQLFPIVTARAVAPLAKLVDWCFPLLTPKGQLLALKGESVNTEIEAAEDVLTQWNATAEVKELAIPGLIEKTWCVLVSKQM